MSRTVLSTKRRFVILSMMVCVAVSGCGVRQGMENVQNAQDVKKQVENGQHKLEKKLREGQKNLEENR